MSTNNIAKYISDPGVRKTEKIANSTTDPRAAINVKRLLHSVFNEAKDETLPKAQRTRGLSSAHQINLF